MQHNEGLQPSAADKRNSGAARVAVALILIYVAATLAGVLVATT